LSGWVRARLQPRGARSRCGIRSRIGVGRRDADRCATADTILTNGRVLTLDAQSSVVQALAIRDDKIVAAGASAEIAKHADGKTRVIDLGGRTVIPGLIDSHIHAIRAGLKFSTEVSWIGATSIAEAMERMRLAAIYARPGTWIVVGGGWTRASLPNGGGRQRPSSSRRRRIIRFTSSCFIAPCC